MYNWLRSHWRNGRHVVHDVPTIWASQIEDYLGRQRTPRRNLGEVRVCAFDDFDLAWIETEVQLDSESGDLTYRRARYLHGIVQPAGEQARLTPRTAHAYLETAYGPSVSDGIAAQQRVLQRLAYPEDESAVRKFCMETDAPDAASAIPTFEVPDETCVAEASPELPPAPEPPQVHPDPTVAPAPLVEVGARSAPPSSPSPHAGARSNASLSSLLRSSP